MPLPTEPVGASPGQSRFPRGIIVRVDNERPCFVPLQAEAFTGSPDEVSVALRFLISTTLGFASDIFSVDEEMAGGHFRLLYKQKSLDEGNVASDFLRSLESGNAPCMVRALFRLVGGKGGFGATLRSQKGAKKKTKNFDSMRDLSGRRLRHSLAVDRIKEWMKKRKDENELVQSLSGEGPDLPTSDAKAVTLDPKFLAQLKRGAVERPGIIQEGLRRQQDEEAEPSKRVRANSGFPSGPTGHIAFQAMSFGSKLPVGKLCGTFDPLDALGAISGSGASSGASGDEDLLDKAAVIQAAATSSNAACASATTAAVATSNSDAPLLKPTCQGEPDLRKCPAADRSGAPSSVATIRVPDGGSGADLGCALITVAKAETASTFDESSKELIRLEELANYASVESLLSDVSADNLKWSLQKLGLKCGGTPADRAKRLFLLKSTALKDIPKKELAVATRRAP